MKILKAGESGRKSTKVKDNDIVSCEHVSAHPALPKDAKFQLTWNVDLSRLTESEKDIAAAEYFLIKIRRDFVKDGVAKKDGKVIKTVKPTAEKWDGVTFDAAKYVTKRQSKVEKIAKTLDQFSDEELAALGLKRA